MVVTAPGTIENGVPETYARRNSWLVPGNKDCILKLYRSAVHIGKEWQPELEQVLDLPVVDAGRIGCDPGVEKLDLGITRFAGLIEQSEEGLLVGNADRLGEGIADQENPAMI